MVWKNTLDFFIYLFTAPAEYGAEEVALDAVLKPGFGSGLGSHVCCCSEWGVVNVAEQFYTEPGFNPYGVQLI